ncbi:MAG: HprK-related kinase A [Betaproteobacteria bacterium HGW-Betaproteobacteria-7]|nr:MAG: HprK-related kinase A [Betaproteobacteria bacterium HGW-Betaproteobacteria-7]
MIVRELSPEDIRESLTSGRFRLDAGSFRVKVTSDIWGFASALQVLYADHPCNLDGGEFDYDIGVIHPNLLRRYIRHNVVFELSGERPFLPVATDHAHALFEWGFNWSIGAHAHQFLILHSAVLETGGKGVLLSATSGSGKSTLAAEMALSGWRLLSDELALIDTEGRLQPCPRPVSLKNDSIEVIRTRHPEVVLGPLARDTHKGTIGHVPAPASAVARASELAIPRLIVFPKWQAGASLSIEPVAQGRAAMRLIDQSFNYSNLGPAGFVRLADLVGTAEAWDLEYSSLDEARDALRDLAAQYG